MTRCRLARRGSSLVVVSAKQGDKVLTAVMIDAEGALNVAWVSDVDQPWQGPVRIGGTDFQPGAPVALAAQGGTVLTAIAVDVKGTLRVAWVTDTGSWHDPVAVGPAMFSSG